MCVLIPRATNLLHVFRDICMTCSGTKNISITGFSGTMSVIATPAYGSPGVVTDMAQQHSHHHYKYHYICRVMFPKLRH